MDSIDLFDAAMNEREEHDVIVSCVKRLRRAMNSVADKHARQVASELQTKPRKAHRQCKEKAIKDMVRYYLKEMRFNEY